MSIASRKREINIYRGANLQFTVIPTEFRQLVLNYRHCHWKLNFEIQRKIQLSAVIVIFKSCALNNSTTYHAASVLNLNYLLQVDGPIVIYLACRKRLTALGKLNGKKKNTAGRSATALQTRRKIIIMNDKG